LGSVDVRIGRDPTCDWIVDYANVSRHHAVVRPLGDHNVVLDLGSTNGLRVNGQSLGDKPHVLVQGDVIELTPAVVLLYEEGPFASSTPWVVTAVAMLILLIASAGLYLATTVSPPEVSAAPKGVPTRAKDRGPEPTRPGTHSGMPPARPPHRRASDVAVRALRLGWQAVARVRSFGDRRPGTPREGDPL
jgi:hypothetical protein